MYTLLCKILIGDSRRLFGCIFFFSVDWLYVYALANIQKNNTYMNHNIILCGKCKRGNIAF